MFKFHPRQLIARGYWGPADDGTGSAGGTGGGGTGDGGTGDGGTGGEGGAGDGKKPDSGTAKPTDAEAALLRDLMKQKERNRELADGIAQAKEQLKAFEGIDPAKVRELLKSIEDDERKKLENKGEYDRLVKQMGERHTAELTAKEALLEAERSSKLSLSQQIAELTVGNSFKTSEFLKELTLTPAKAKVIYSGHFEFKDGRVVAYDKPAGQAERTPLVNSAGEPLDFEAAFKKIVDADPERDLLYRSKVKQGAGSGTAPKDGSKNQGDDKKLTPIERIAKGLKALGDQQK